MMMRIGTNRNASTRPTQILSATLSPRDSTVVPYSASNAPSRLARKR
jgi:hypothetical protein